MLPSNLQSKARKKVARLHAKIMDCRRDFTHKLTTQLINDNQVISCESLSVKNMVKNRKLAKAISDANWGELIRQLTYKAEWYGRTVIQIDKWYPSSKRCNCCGHVVDSLPLNIRHWDCPSCKTRLDRDINASLNIKAVGQTVLDFHENQFDIQHVKSILQKCHPQKALDSIYNTRHTTQSLAIFNRHSLLSSEG